VAVAAAEVLVVAAEVLAAVAAAAVQPSRS
jgi:hypothetical protein